MTEEQFADFKGVIRSRKWKKERQYKNVKKDKQWYTKHYTENYASSNSTKQGVSSSATDGKAVSDLHVAHFVLILLQTR